MKTEKMETPSHYNNDNGSLYKIAEQRGWNAYQFDIIKRIDRALKKGEFLQDLEKTKVVIDLWIKETAEQRLCENMVKFNKEFDLAKEPQKTTDKDKLNFMVDCSDDYKYKKMAERPLCAHMKETEIKVGTIITPKDETYYTDNNRPIKRGNNLKIIDINPAFGTNVVDTKDDRGIIESFTEEQVHRYFTIKI